MLASSFLPSLSGVEGWIGEVDIFLSHALLGQAKSLAEALEMHNLPLAQELDNVIYVRVVAQAEDVVVGNAGLLLWCNHASATWG